VTLTLHDLSGTQVPNLVGMGAKDAVFLAESMGLKARVVGVGKVRAQSIPAGNTLHKGQTILLKLK
jgi:cell division protein FtsI (penicillin-binding protein 3)